jgi:signal transduction histidine kinase
MHGILNFSRFGIDKFQEAPREKLLEYFSEINICACNLMELLEELLELSKLEATDVKSHMDKNDIRKVINSVISNLRSAVEKKSISIVVHRPEISTVAVFDEKKIYRVFEILLSNAIEHSSDGGTITIFFEKNHIKTDLSLIDAVRINIADEAVGLSDKELKAVFNKFFQSSRTKSGAGGKRLGLAICKEIINSHQGNIWAEHNKNGKGNVFVVTIPLNIMYS